MKNKGNNVLRKIFTEDQKARKNIPGGQQPASVWNKISAADEKRRKQVASIMSTGANFTTKDYYYAAMIFQHGDYMEEYKTAKRYAKQSMDMGYDAAKWLYAAATDRLLRAQGKKQKFGTQYVFGYLKEDNVWYEALLLQPYDKRTTDVARAKYNVPPLAELQKKETRKIWR
mgnify:CR=1 FL=1